MEKVLLGMHYRKKDYIMKMDMLRNMNQSAMNTAKTNGHQTVHTPQQTTQQAQQQVQPLNEQELLEMRLALLNQQEKTKLQNNQELLKTLQDLKKNFVEIDKDLKKLSSEIQGFHVKAYNNYKSSVQVPFNAVCKTAEETNNLLHIVQEEHKNISSSWSYSIFLTSFIASLSTSILLFILYNILPKLINN